MGRNILSKDEDLRTKVNNALAEQLQASAQLVADVINLANQSSFYDLSSSCVPQDACYDRFTYTVVSSVYSGIPSIHDPAPNLNNLHTII